MKIDESPILKLISLRWGVDQLVYLHEYDAYYWLTACFDNKGERIGITSCCENGFECNYHKNLKTKIGCQNTVSN